MKFFFTIVVIAVIFGALVGGAMLWDGSYYLYKALDTGEPYAPHGRLINVPLQWPVIWASQIIRDVNVLKTFFGLMYALVPIGSLLAAWWIVKDDHPTLFIWAALGIGFGTLMLQLTFVAEAILVLQLFWPLLLGLLVPTRPSVTVIMVVCTVVIMFSHPTAILLLAFAALVAFVVGWRYRERRAQLWVWAAAFCAAITVVVLRFVTMSDTYESERLTWDTLVATFSSSMTGIRIIGVLSMYLVAAIIFLVPFILHFRSRLVERWKIQARPLSQVLYGLELISIVLAGLALLIWGAYPRLWQTALTYRTWTLFVSLPFMCLAVLEALIQGFGWRPELEVSWQHRRRAVQMVGMVFLVVLVTQSLSWVRLDNSLRQTVAASSSACVPQSTISQQNADLLGHWSMTPYSILQQGIQPQKIVLPDDVCQKYQFANNLPVADWDQRDWQGGWFNMSQLNQELVAKQSSAR